MTMLTTADIIALLAIIVTIIIVIAKRMSDNSKRISNIVTKLQNELTLIKADTQYIKEDIDKLKANYDDDTEICEVKKTVDKLSDKINNLDKLVDAIAVKLELLTSGISSLNIRKKTRNT